MENGELISEKRKGGRMKLKPLFKIFSIFNFQFSMNNSYVTERYTSQNQYDLIDTILPWLNF